MHPLPPSHVAKKSNKGRQKIEMKKVEQKSKLLVTFSKRKLGLFRKASELSLLCDSQVAVLVFSPAGKIYSSGHPDPDSVLHRYLSGATTDQNVKSKVVATLRQQYEVALKELQEEKLKKVEKSELWWTRTIQDMDLEHLHKFKESVQKLRQHVVAVAEKKTPVTRDLTETEISYMRLLNGDFI